MLLRSGAIRARMLLISPRSAEAEFCAWCFVPGFLCRYKAPGTKHQAQINMRRSPLIVIFTTVFIDLVGFGIVIPVLPFYAEGTAFGATPRTVGLLFASYSIMQLIFSPILGGLSDKYGRRPVLLLSIIGTGIGFLILGVAKTISMLFIGRILDGITGGNISTAQAYIADVTSEENRAKG